LPDESYHAVLAVKACARLRRARERASRGLDGCAAACGFAGSGQSRPSSEIVMKGNAMYVRDEQGQFEIASCALILEAARTQLRSRVRRGTPLNNPQLVRDFLTVTLGDRDCEYFCLLLLDTHHRLLQFVELFRGTIDGARVYPREVVKTVLDARAAAVLVVHNHPSQVAEPSAADELITRKLRSALDVIEVRLLDHLIVAGADVVSFAERGLL
jgi:DNA repair protein RadC